MVTKTVKCPHCGATMQVEVTDSMNEENKLTCRNCKKEVWVKNYGLIGGKFL